MGATTQRTKTSPRERHPPPTSGWVGGLESSCYIFDLGRIPKELQRIKKEEEEANRRYEERMKQKEEAEDRVFMIGF